LDGTQGGDAASFSAAMRQKNRQAQGNDAGTVFLCLTFF